MQLSPEQLIDVLERKGIGLWETADGSVITGRMMHGTVVQGIAASGSGYYDNAGKKHVLMVSGPACIRVQKTAQALRDRGWRVDSLSTRIPDMDAFDYAVVTEPRRLPDLVAASGASIIHVHNEPDALMVFAKLGSRGRPVVYDCHDLEYHRLGFVDEPERYAFASADGIVNVGERYRQVAWDLHPWTAPDIVVRSLPVRAWVPETPDEGRSGIVYQGGAVEPGGPAAWRDFTDTVTQLAARGWPLHMYVSDEVKEQYEALGAIVHGWLPYREMLAELGKYEFGFVGLDKPNEKLVNASPNKINEYAACGVIPAICNMPALAAEFGPCISADSIDELVDAMEAADAAALRPQVRAAVPYMDDEVEKTEALYEALL